ncbi:MAG: hypothetical protein KJ971_04755 [Firmicutes bacterium]|nr:hypothetical protein [Bacillota bacterium]
MLSFLVGFMIDSFWISLIGGTSFLFLLRLVVAVNSKVTIKQFLFVLFMPCSLGFYLTFPDSSRFKLIYQLIFVVFFLFTLIGSVFVFYTHFA